MHLPASTSRGSRCCVWEAGKLQEAWLGVPLGGVEWDYLEQSWQDWGHCVPQGSNLWRPRAQEMGLWKRKRKDGAFWAGDI